MGSTRREKGVSVGRRLTEGAMTLGIMILLGGLVSAFVVVAVFLVSPAEGRSKLVPIAQAAPEAPATSVVALAPSLPQQVSITPEEAAPGRRGAVGLDDEGYIRLWAVLAPIPLEKELSGAVEIHKEQVPGEAKLRPKLETKVKAAGRELRWKRHEAPGAVVDFRKIAEGDRTDDVAGYAVCILVSKEERRGIALQMGSNDQAKVYLNGKPVAVHDVSRTLEKGKEAARDLVLRKGENLVVFKVINEKNNWQGCVRFVDGKGAPVRELEVTLGAP